MFNKFRYKDVESFWNMNNDRKSSDINKQIYMHMGGTYSFLSIIFIFFRFADLV